MNVTMDLKENFNPNGSKSQSIKSRVESFESQIKSYTGRDPFNIWENYINYLKEINKDELKQIGIKIHQVYQRCINKCQPYNYHNSERFVQIFMEYIKNYDTNPLNKFEWMYNHKYGFKYEDFYFEWSQIYEKNNQFDDAIRIIEIGIKNCTSKNSKLTNVLKRLKPENVANNQDAEMCKFGFNCKQLYPNHPNLNGEYSFEELRAIPILKAYNHIKLRQDEEKQKYMNEINELKAQLELANKIGKEIAKKKKSRPQDSMFTKTTDNFELTNVTVNNQTSIWKTDKNDDDNDENVDDDDDDDDEMNEVEMEDDDEFDNRIKFDSEDKPFERTMPPPPPVPTTELSTLNETKIVMTLNSGANATMNVQANSSNNSICTKMFDDRKNLSKMFHMSKFDLTTNTTISNTKFGESIVVFNEKSTEKTARDFSIYVDQTNSNQSNVSSSTINTKTVKKYNEDGSLFVYEDSNATVNRILVKPTKINDDSNVSQQLATTPTINKLNTQMESAKNTSTTILFESNKSIINNNDNSTIKLTNEINDESRVDDFEPAVASTCYLHSVKPILKKDNLKPLNEVDEEEENEDEMEKELAKEKLLEMHLAQNSQKLNVVGSNENDMSKLLSEDCLTQSTKWLKNTRFKKEHSVRFMSPAEMTTKKENIFNTSNTKNLTETINEQKTLAHGQDISWEIDDIEMHDQHDQNDTVNVIDFDLIKADYKPAETFKLVDSENFNLDNDEDIGKLTSEKLNETYNADYFRIFFATSVLNTPGVASQIFNKLVDDQIKSFNANETKQQILSERSMISLSHLTGLPTIKINCENESLILNKTETIKQSESIVNDSLKSEKIETIESELVIPDTQEQCIKLEPQPTVKLSKNETFEIENSQMIQSESISANLSLLKSKPTTVVNLSTRLEKTLIVEKNDEKITNLIDDNNQTFNDNMTVLDETTVHNATNMNETIIQAIRDPFSFDVKTRLLARGPIEKLQSNTSYKSLCSFAPVIIKKHNVQLNDQDFYNIKEEIGKGAYAQIYLIQNKSKKDKKYALKVDKQATAWEFYITETIHERLSDMIRKNEMLIDVSNSIIKIEQFMKFSNGCFSAMTYYKNGSLLDLINFHLERDKLEFPYWFVIYLTLEMLNILDYLHKCKVLHADIKADNFLVDQLPMTIDYFVANKTKCLVLIDFNRSIDLSMLPNEAEFDAKTENKSLLCCEMKSNKTWTYQIDFYGVLSSIHCIIFRRYMEVFQENNRFKITKKMPRSYDSLFNDLFDTYLNIPSCQQIPNLEQDWIVKFVNLFKHELANSFHKSSNYLKALHQYYSSRT